MRNGLAFISKAQSKNKSQAPQTNGIMVFTNSQAPSCLVELVSVGMADDGNIRVIVRNEANERMELDSFKNLRKAFPSELMARARKGSDQFNTYWAQNRHRYN